MHTCMLKFNSVLQFLTHCTVRSFFSQLFNYTTSFIRSAERDAHLLFTICPLTENKRSLGTDEAGDPKNIKACEAATLCAGACPLHHSSRQEQLSICSCDWKRVKICSESEV